MLVMGIYGPIAGGHRNDRRGHRAGHGGLELHRPAVPDDRCRRRRFPDRAAARAPVLLGLARARVLVRQGLPRRDADRPAEPLHRRRRNRDRPRARVASGLFQFIVPVWLRGDRGRCSPASRSRSRPPGSGRGGRCRRARASGSATRSRTASRTAPNGEVEAVGPGVRRPSPATPPPPEAQAQAPALTCGPARGPRGRVRLARAARSGLRYVEARHLEAGVSDREDARGQNRVPDQIGELSRGRKGEERRYLPLHGRDGARAGCAVNVTQNETRAASRGSWRDRSGVRGLGAPPPRRGCCSKQQQNRH